MQRALYIMLAVAVVCMLLTFVLARVSSVPLSFVMAIYMVEKIAIVLAIVLFIARAILKQRRRAA